MSFAYDAKFQLIHQRLDRMERVIEEIRKDQRELREILQPEKPKTLTLKRDTRQ